MIRDSRLKRMLRTWWRAARWVVSCALLMMAEKVAPQDVQYSLLVVIAGELGISEARRECDRLKFMLDLADRS